MHSCLFYCNTLDDIPGWNYVQSEIVHNWPLDVLFDNYGGWVSAAISYIQPFSVVVVVMVMLSAIGIILYKIYSFNQ